MGSILQLGRKKLHEVTHVHRWPRSEPARILSHRGAGRRRSLYRTVSLCNLLLAAFNVNYDRGGACLPREVASAAEGTCETSARAARTRS